MRKRGRGLIEGIMLAVLVAACLWPVRAEFLTPLTRAVFDGLHFPLFLAATVLIYRGFARERFSGIRALFALAGGLLLAGIVEGLQALLGRQASVEDFLRGASGVALGALGCFLFSGDWHWRGAFLAAVIVVGALELLPAGRLFLAVRWQKAQFPVLGDFEEPAELLLWTPQGINGRGERTTTDRNKAFASRGSYSLRVKTSGGPGHAGVGLDTGRQDWRNYETLAWEIWNPGAAFSLGVRIDDDGDVSTAERRFATAVEVMRGSNAFEIPLEEVRSGASARLVNMRVIRRILFYTGENSPPREFFLDGLRLERGRAGRRGDAEARGGDGATGSGG